MDSQTASEQIIKTCEAYKTQHGQYPTELKVDDETWYALHGEGRFRIMLPLPTTFSPMDFDPTDLMNAPPTIPLVNITPLRRQG